MTQDLNAIINENYGVLQPKSYNLGKTESGHTWNVSNNPSLHIYSEYSRSKLKQQVGLKTVMDVHEV